MLPTKQPSLLMLAGLFYLPSTTLGNPEYMQPTSAAELEQASTRVTTSFYSFVTTEIPRDEHSIGMGLQRDRTDEYCKILPIFCLWRRFLIHSDWLYCINDSFTTKSGFAGCGTDDLYTACSGRVATGIDGGEILWYATHLFFTRLD